MADDIGDNKKDRDGKSVGVETTAIPFIDYLLCCYVYIGNGGIDTNDKRDTKRVNNAKVGR